MKANEKAVLFNKKKHSFLSQWFITQSFLCKFVINNQKRYAYRETTTHGGCRIYKKMAR